MRFEEFCGEWETVRLGEVATFSKGKGISKSDISDEGILQCIRYGQLYTQYNEIIDEVISKTELAPKELVLSDYNDVIIPASGESEIDIATASCVKQKGIALGGDLNIIKSEINGVFLSYYLNNSKKYDIARLAQGISVVHLYSSQLRLLKLNLPIEEEQIKLAEFIEKLDQRITTQRQLIQEQESLMKGMMQKVFSQDIRFKDENGENFPDWEKKVLSNLGRTFNGLSGKTKEDFGCGKKFIQYSQVFGNYRINTDHCGEVDIRKNEKQNKVQYGDILFTTSSETEIEVGTSSVFTEYEDEVYLNSFCFGFRPFSKEELLPHFSQYFFRSHKVRKEIVKLAQGSTRFNMPKTEFMKLSFYFPSNNEQTKIANFLSSIKSKLEKEKTILMAYEQQKKYLLQNMFV